MPHYRYTDYALGPVVEIVKQSWRGGIPWSAGPYHEKRAGEVVFECDATDIVAADEFFTQSTGRIPAKEFLVGCAIS